MYHCNPYEQPSVFIDVRRIEPTRLSTHDPGLDAHVPPRAALDGIPRLKDAVQRVLATRFVLLLLLQSPPPILPALRRARRRSFANSTSGTAATPRSAGSADAIPKSCANTPRRRLRRRRASGDQALPAPGVGTVHHRVDHLARE